MNMNNKPDEVKAERAAEHAVEHTQHTMHTEHTEHIKSKKPAEEKKMTQEKTEKITKVIKTAAHKAPEAKTHVHGKLALILIRGLVRVRGDIVATLFTLRLRRRHACVVLDDIPSNRLAAAKCKDYIAYGEIDDETYKFLVEKRGKKDEKGNLKKFFSLDSPRGGFERKGIKTPFTNGGALGYRKEKINVLLRKMI